MEEKYLEYAKQELLNKEYTCVLYNGTDTITSKNRGVAPLLGWIEEERNFEGYVAADKVVGKATAFLYVTLNVKAVYGKVISRSAVNVFEKYGVKFSYDEMVDKIMNRMRTGYCPMEDATREIENTKEALDAIKKRYMELSKK